MLTWDDLKHFLAFARTGSMLTAAQAQGANHSTVRRRLAALEKHLGCKLVERHLSGYRLTEVGVGLLPYAERVEEAVAACERYAASCDKGLTGVVRLACSPTVGERLRRAPLFETFQARFPGLRIELLLSDRLVDLAKGEADIAIRTYGREPEEDSLVGRKIAEDPWAVYASRSYVERHGRPETPEDLPATAWSNSADRSRTMPRPSGCAGWPRTRPSGPAAKAFRDWFSPSNRALALRHCQPFLARRRPTLFA